MASNITGIGSRKRPHPATVSLLDSRALAHATASDAAENGRDSQRTLLPAGLRQGEHREEDPLRAKPVLGYPASWPAGPWVLPLFWLTLVVLALLQRAIG